MWRIDTYGFAYLVDRPLNLVEGGAVEEIAFWDDLNQWVSNHGCYSEANDARSIVNFKPLNLVNKTVTDTHMNGKLYLLHSEMTTLKRG